MASRVSELRGLRMSLVSLTLSGGDIFIFASSPGSPFRRNEKIVVRNFLIRYRSSLARRSPPRNAKSVVAELITLERDSTRRNRREIQMTISNVAFNREIRYSRASSPWLSAAPLNSATLLLGMKKGLSRRFHVPTTFRDRDTNLPTLLRHPRILLHSAGR